MAVADELARLIALEDAGHLSDEEFQAAKAAVLGQTRIDHAPPPERPTAVIPAPPLGDEALQTATFPAATRRSRRPLLVALATLIILLAAGVAFVVTGSKNQVASGGSSPNSAATESPASPLPSLTTAASTSPAPAPPIVTSKALLAALHGRPLVADPDIPAAVVSASNDYTPPGDSVPSARLLGGVSFTIDANQSNAVDTNVLIFEGPQDAAAQNQQELDTAQAGGTPYSTLTVDKSGSSYLRWGLDSPPPMRSMRRR